MGRDTEVEQRREDGGDEILRMLAKEPGKKFDNGKPPVFMGVLQYFPRALKAVAEVSAYGAKKYDLDLADKNWMTVENGYARYSNALTRHVVEEGIDMYDAESGLLHAQMVAWNALARLELLMIEFEDQEASTKG